MYTEYIMRRTQIYLDQEQARRLDRWAAGEGVTRSAVIREAIDGYLSRPEPGGARLGRFRAAVRTAAGAAPYLPAGEEYVEGIRAAGARRLGEIGRRGRRRR